MFPFVIYQKPHAFSGAKSPPMTWSRSRKNYIMVCIFSTRSSSLCFSSLTSDGTTSMVVSLFVTPHVLLSTKDSPGSTCSSSPYTATNLIQSNLSSRAINNRWLISAHKTGDAQLPWPIPYRSFLRVDVPLCISQ
jgi:hypothetical protein